MKKGYKRVLSFAVATTMVLGGFTFVPATAYAKESFPTLVEARYNQ